MLLVSGLDVTIVGRYDYGQTAFYAIATTPTNFMIGIIGAALAPLMPATSALNVHRTPAHMGMLLARVTRYVSTLLVVSGLPLLVAGYWVLRLWVGHSYAPQIVGYMRILVLANVVRMLCAPYANMLIATDSQRSAVLAACAEGLVNVICSVYLVRHIGALGVAYGTLIGAFVGVVMHFALSMHYTYAQFAVTRARLFLSGIVRPLSIAIPSLILLPRWWSRAAPNFGFLTWLLWGITTALLVWFAGLIPSERSSVLKRPRQWAGL
jgi:O-antigen/teichoic acid export membrane protein